MERKMKLTAESALDVVAKRDGVSVEAVRSDIEAAIVAAKKNTNPTVRAFWSSVPRKGDDPTPEELIAYIAGTLKMNLNL